MRYLLLLIGLILHVRCLSDAAPSWFLAPRSGKTLEKQRNAYEIFRIFRFLSFNLETNPSTHMIYIDVFLGKKRRRAKLNKVELKRHANLRKRSIRVHPRVVDEIEDRKRTFAGNVTKFLNRNLAIRSLLAVFDQLFSRARPYFRRRKLYLSKDTRIHSFAYRRIFVGNYGGFENW